MGRSGPVADGRHAAAEGAAGRRGAVAHAALGRCAHSLWLPSHARIGGWRRLPSGRSGGGDPVLFRRWHGDRASQRHRGGRQLSGRKRGGGLPHEAQAAACLRSEEHTSELQSLMRISYAVFCLEKTKKRETNRNKPTRRKPT